MFLAKFNLLVFIFLAPLFLYSQFDLTIRGGGLVDMYRVKSEVDDGVFIPWTKNVASRRSWDYPFLNIELSYNFNKKYKIGVRYHFDEYMIQSCTLASNNGTTCDQVNDDSILKISSHFSRNYYIHKYWTFSPSIGIGASFTYYDGYLYDDGSKITGKGKGGLVAHDINGAEVFSLFTMETEYLEQEISLFIPVQIDFNYRFNEFLNISFNFGYSQYLVEAIHKTKITYIFDHSNERKVEISTGNNMYLGVGIGYHFDIIKNKRQ